MQIINQPSLSWSHSNKLLLTQWQFPNESINALYLNFIFSDVDIFLREEPQPRTTYLAGDFSTPPGHCKHTHTHTHTYTHHSLSPFLSSTYTHTRISRRKIIPCPAALASRPTSITASEQTNTLGNAHWRLPRNMDTSSLIWRRSVRVPCCCHYH